jgi:hypothetical protein
VVWGNTWCQAPHEGAWHRRITGLTGGAVTKDDSTRPLVMCYFSTIFALKLLYLNKKYWQIMLDTVTKVIYNKFK